MIEIKDKHNCVGCEACGAVCPKECISFNYDSEGFVYPVVDKAFCIDCSRCDKVCPVINRYPSSLPRSVYAAYSNNEDIRRLRSSGGVFYELARSVFSTGGIVFAVRFDKDWNPVYDRCERLEDIIPFLGSKYVQAYPGDTFANIKTLLKNGKTVMFVGSPCYVAALRRFLKKEYDNLLAVDFICHGVPGTKVWQKFRSCYADISDLRNVGFRDKSNGWRQYSLLLEKKNDETLIFSLKNNLYQKGLISGLTLRPSCYKCPAKEFRSLSDITLGEFWGVETVVKIENDNKGVSLITITSRKGESFYEKADIYSLRVAYPKALKYNARLIESAHINGKREKFFNDIDKKDILENLEENLRYGYLDKKLHKYRLKVYTIKRALHLLKNKQRE